jgi:hypothetical protein
VQSRINEQTPRHEPPATLQRVFPTAKALHFSPAKRHDFSPPFTLLSVGEPIQDDLHLLRRLVPVFGPVGTGLHNDFSERSWYKRSLLFKFREVSTGANFKQLGCCQRIPRSSTGGHFIERNPEGIDIGTLVTVAPKLFRCHKTRSADDVPGAAQVAPIIQNFCQPKIRHPDFSGSVENQIARLDISMNRAILMRVAQRRCNICSQSGQLPEIRVSSNDSVNRF